VTILERASPLAYHSSSRSKQRARSLHVGLNHVDPKAYNGFDEALTNPVNDANAMRDLAESLVYDTTVVTNEQATSVRVLAEISRAARELGSGDIFLLTYSGHGGQVDDANNDEPDREDETWALWDRQVVDDELYALWAQFEPRVRIVVLSDSCHSGTVAKLDMTRKIQRYRSRAKGTGEPKSKKLPQASVILISGCQDPQNSYEGDYHSRFTGTLLKVWANGDFHGDYKAFHREIRKRMPSNQSPNYFTTGMPYPEFEAQRPFTIECPAAAVGPGTTP